MRHLLLIILTALFLPNKILAQELLDSNQKMLTTAKIWGFLKYYHPNVAIGKYDWDNQLLETIPAIEKATTKEELSEIYLTWIESLGKVQLCKKCNETDNNVEHFDKNFDLSWTENDQLFTNELSVKLKYIVQNRFQGKHQYVALKGKPPVLAITNEKSYPNFVWTNKPLRLLSLFRYWNTIEYFYPHKYQIDTNWNEVFIQMLPKFSSPVSETDYHLAMLELVVKIDDSHGYFTTEVIDKYFGFKQIPAAFAIIENKVIITHLYDDSLARKNDIKVGDVITKVENVEVGEIIRQNLKYINGANNCAKMKNASRQILNGSSDSVKVEITRGKETKVRKVARYTFDKFHYSTNLKSWKTIEDNIGYINLSTISENELMEALSGLVNSKTIILDLRNYPKNYFGSYFKNYFGAKNTMIAKQMNLDLQYPGKFILTEQSTSMTESKYKGKVILLINEQTQSRAEYTAMWIQNGYNVTTVGSQTAGAGGIMISQEFVGGYNSYFTSSGIFYPDMSPIQREGVKIDIEVTPTIEGIINGQDEVLEKAIEIALK